jgi:hypothetical protein
MCVHPGKEATPIPGRSLFRPQHSPHLRSALRSALVRSDGTAPLTSLVAVFPAVFLASTVIG